MDTRSFIIATNGRLKWWLHHTLSDLTPERQQNAGDALSAALTHALTHAGGIAGIRAIGGFPVPPEY